MPARLVETIAKNAEADRARAADRDTTRLERRIEKLLNKISVKDHPEYLETMKGAPYLTKWEHAFTTLGMGILLDELLNHLIRELPVIDAQLREEMALVDEIGPDGLRAIPPITLDDLEKVIREVEDVQG